MMAILLTPHADPRYITPAHPPAFSIQELHALVGGFIEAIVLPWHVVSGFNGTKDGGPLIMFVNEDGKRLGLPYNGFATAMVRHLIAADDAIAGPVVICTQEEAGED